MSGAPAGDASRQLVERIHALLADGQLRDVQMFGATAIMLDDAMAVAVHRDGSLLVRADPDEGEALLTEPGASQAVMGSRSMGAGWLRVDAAVLASDAALRGWVHVATRYLDRRAGKRS